MVDPGIAPIAQPASAAARDPALTRIPPASFRGIDCSMLAAQYAAFRMLQTAATLAERDPSRDI